MGMELLTRTNVVPMHQAAGDIATAMQTWDDNNLRLDGAVESLRPVWEGEAADSLFVLWTDYFNAQRELNLVMHRAAHDLGELADRLERAQRMYRDAIAAAEEAGFQVLPDGRIALPPADPNTDIAYQGVRADHFRELQLRIEDALAEAEDADRRAADEFLKVPSEAILALGRFLKTWNESAEPLYSALGGGLLTAAQGLERFAQNPTVPALERTRALAAAQRYRALANSPVFRAANAKVLKHVTALTAAGVPLNYVQHVAEGDDRGLAATKAGVSGGLSIGIGVGAGAAAAAVATAAAAAPPVAAAGAVLFYIGGSATGQAIGNRISPWVHKNIVTPYVAPIAVPLGQDIQEFGDDLRTDFWRMVDDMKYYGRNFPEDFREAIMG